MKTSKWIFSGAAAVGAAFVVSCSGGGDNQGGGDSFNTLRLLLQSSSITALAEKFSAPLAGMAACSVSIDGVNTNGNCTDILWMKAAAQKFHVNSSYGGSGPTRLLDYAAAEEGGFDGPFGFLGMANFDFQNPAASNNLYSEDSIQDATIGTIYNQASISLGGVEYRFNAPNSATPYWTVRLPFIDQDLSDVSTGSETLEQCLAGRTETLEKLETEKVFDGPMGFLAGDMLLCKKAGAGDECADGDFQWINSGDGSLTGTRPGSPVRISGSNLIINASCSTDGEHPDVTLPTADMRFGLTEGFKISKEFLDGGLPHYTFQGECTATGATTGTCTGAESEGTYIDVTVDFDLSQALFIDNTLDLNSDSDAVLQAGLDGILPKSLYIDNYKVGEGTGDDPGIVAEITATLTESAPADFEEE